MDQFAARLACWCRGRVSDPTDELVDVCAVADLVPGTQRLVSLGASKVLLCRVGDDIHAVAPLCPHALQPIAGGRVRDGAIQCPRHGARFDLRTGRALNAVTAQPLGIHQVRIEAGRVFVSLAIARAAAPADILDQCALRSDRSIT